MKISFSQAYMCIQPEQGRVRVVNDTHAYSFTTTMSVPALAKKMQEYEDTLQITKGHLRNIGYGISYSNGKAFVFISTIESEVQQIEKLCG